MQDNLYLAFVGDWLDRNAPARAGCPVGNPHGQSGGLVYISYLTGGFMPTVPKGKENPKAQGYEPKSFEAITAKWGLDKDVPNEILHPEGLCIWCGEVTADWWMYEQGFCQCNPCYHAGRHF